MRTCKNKYLKCHYVKKKSYENVPCKYKICENKEMWNVSMWKCNYVNENMCK